MMSQHDALGQDIGHDLQPFRRRIPERDTARRLHLVVGAGLQADRDLLDLGCFQGLDDARSQRPHDLLLLDGRHPEEHRDAVPEKKDQAVLADA